MPQRLSMTVSLLGYSLHLQRRPWLAGLCLGIFVPVKYWPGSILAGFALHRRWRVVLGVCIHGVIRPSRQDVAPLRSATPAAPLP